MLDYRLYCFDGGNHVWAAEWLTAADDAEAVQTARQMNLGTKCEVWEGQRLVASIDRKSTGSQS
jgi:hypothetical protein